MSNSFSGINMASQAMAAFTSAMDTVGNNISNVNTPGYSRQVVNFTEAPTSEGFTSQPITLGNGVAVANITSVRDMFLLGRQLGSTSDLGNTNQQLTGSQTIQTAFNETGSGGNISTDLSNFYNAWSGLASDPTTSASLLAVQQAGATLAGDVSGTYGQMQDLQSQTSQQITSTINSIQSDASQIASLNAEINTANGLGGSTNSLTDQLNQTLQSLAGLVNINTTTNSDGTVNVNVGEFQLVNQSGAQTFPATADSATSTVSDANGTYPIQGGQLAGLFATMNSTTSTMSSLNNIANALTTQVNALMSTGKNGLGQTGQNFFQAPTPPATTISAANFKLDPAVAANAQAIAAGTTGNGGDGSIALAIANSDTTPVTGLGNVSVTNYYNNLVDSIGTQVSSLTSQQSTQQALGTQITNQIQSVSGVSLDQEMSTLVQYQQSYQSAAQALNICNQNLTYLMTMMNSA